MPKPTRCTAQSLIDAVLSGINPAASAYLTGIPLTRRMLRMCLA